MKQSQTGKRLLPRMKRKDGWMNKRDFHSITITTNSAGKLIIFSSSVVRCGRKMGPFPLLKEEEETSLVFGAAGKGLRVGSGGKHIETTVLKTSDQKTSRSTKGTRRTSTTSSLTSFSARLRQTRRKGTKRRGKQNKRTTEKRSSDRVSVFNCFDPLHLPLILLSSSLLCVLLKRTTLSPLRSFDLFDLIFFVACGVEKRRQGRPQRAKGGAPQR